MSRPLRFALALAALALTTGAAFATSISISRPTLSTPSAETQRFLDGQFVRAVDVAESTYAGLTVGYQGFSNRVGSSSGSVRIDVVAADYDGQTMLVFNGATSSGVSESFVYRMPWTETLYREIASILGFFADVLGAKATPPRGEVEYFQDFQSDYIATGDLPVTSAFYPMSLATRDGNLLIASNNFVVEVDRYFREQGKIGVGAQIPGLWASHVAATPAGTIVAASTSQGGIVRLVPGIPTPYRVQTRNAVTDLAVADDGTIFTLDMQQNFLRFGPSGTGPVDLGLPADTYISFVNTGPDNTLMLWEPTQRSILIYQADGTRVGSIVPHVAMDVAMGMKYFQAYNNGDVFAAFNDRLARFSRDGSVIWQVMADDLPELGGLMFYTEVQLDPSDGTIYLLSIQQKRIVELIDPSVIRRSRQLTATERDILASNAKLRDNPYDQQALAERARRYEDAQAWEEAAFAWDTAYGIDPMNGTVAAARDAVATRMLEENARRLYEQALNLLEQFGVATAAYSYQQAQTAYEKVISSSPDNSEARTRLDELRRRFEEAQNPERATPPLRIDDIAIDDLFPSLFTSYQNTPAGTVTVRNTGSTELRNVSVRAEMRFLDFATQGGSIAALAAGESATIDVMLPISQRALTLQESTPVPVNVTIGYESAGRSLELSQVKVITVQRATALTWDDSAKLVAYITPRDGIVEQYAAPYVGIGEASKYGISEKLFRAARIADAVGASRLEYVEDPQSGITRVLGNPTVIDTVRFPRTTMRVGYGDCDDTTALMCSLFESVGIATGVMTSPGHVFMAFDSGEPAQNEWLFDSETTTTFTHNGSLWIPFETTILAKGFLASWEEGSRLYRRYSASGELEFLATADQRSRFPALPLDPASFSVTPPPESIVDPVYAQSISRLRDTLYHSNVARLTQSLSGQRGRSRARTLNQIGILHGQFSDPAAAERSLRDAISADPDYTASYINLANISLLAGKPRDALTWLDQADARRPAGVIATLLRAQAEYASGNRSAAAEQMAIVEERAPELAAQYPYLSGEGTARASEAQARPLMPWPVDEP